MGQSGLPTIALAIAIAGLVFSFIPCCCLTYILGLPLNIVALVTASRALGDIEKGVAVPDGEGHARAAKYVSYAGLALNALWVLIWVLYVVFVVGLAGIGTLVDQLTP